jgi:hypothetical protein
VEGQGGSRLTMSVDAASGDDELLAGNDLGVDSHDHAGRDSLHHIGVASLSDTDDEALVDTNVGLGAKGRSARPPKEGRGRRLTL